MGGHYEVDLRARGIDPLLGEACAGYLAGDRVFAEGLTGEDLLGPWVAVRKRLGVWRQGSGKGAGRRDLVEQLEALGQHRELAEVSEALLGATIDVTRLEGLGVDLYTNGNVSEAILSVEGRREWEEQLGGSAWEQEIEREITIIANHAAWRDRQVRRLVEVRSVAIEVHIDPAPWKELLVEDSNADQQKLIGVV